MSDDIRPQRPSLLNYPDRFQKNPGRTVVRPAVSGGQLGPPVAPTGLTATSDVGTDGFKIHLSWTNPAGPKTTGVEIQRKTGAGGTFATIACVRTGILAYVDPVEDVGVYYYQIRAFNSSGDSAWSATAGPYDGGCLVSTAVVGSTRWLQAPNSGAPNQGFQCFSGVNDSYDDNANGGKTLIQLAQPVDTAQAVQPNIVGTGFGWALVTPNVWKSVSSSHNLSTGTFTWDAVSQAIVQLLIRVQYITAVFDATTITWANYTGLTYSGYNDVLEAAYCTIPNPGGSGKSPVGCTIHSLANALAPLFPGNVGATIYGLLVDCKLHPAGGGISAGQATVDWLTAADSGVLFCRTLAGR